MPPPVCASGTPVVAFGASGFKPRLCASLRLPNLGLPNLGLPNLGLLNLGPPSLGRPNLGGQWAFARAAASSLVTRIDEARERSRFFGQSDAENGCAHPRGAPSESSESRDIASRAAEPVFEGFKALERCCRFGENVRDQSCAGWRAFFDLEDCCESNQPFERDLRNLIKTSAGVQELL